MKSQNGLFVPKTNKLFKGQNEPSPPHCISTWMGIRVKNPLVYTPEGGLEPSCIRPWRRIRALHPFVYTPEGDFEPFCKHTWRARAMDLLPCLHTWRLGWWSCRYYPSCISWWWAASWWGSAGSCCTRPACP